MTDPNTTDPKEQQGGQQDADLGEAGRKALAEERQARKEAERRERELREKVAQLEGAELRRKVAAEKGLTEAQAQFLSGDDEEQMKARADELLSSFKPDDDADAGPPRRPQERLRSGAAPSAEPAPTPAKIAESVRRGW